MSCTLKWILIAKALHIYEKLYKLQHAAQWFIGNLLYLQIYKHKQTIQASGVWLCTSCLCLL